MIINNLQDNTLFFSIAPETVIAAIEQLPFGSYKIPQPELLKICALASKKLSSLTKTETSVRVRTTPEETDNKRTLLINVRDPSYSISLSKEIFAREGAVKKITSVLKVSAGSNSEPIVVPYARITSKKGTVISERELKYQEKYGEISDLTKYESKEKEEKVTYLQKKYQHDIFEFVLDGYGDKKDYACELLNVLSTVGKTVKEMHSDEVVHRDIKCLNVLYNHSKDDNDEACLSDFGFTYAPLSEEKTGHALFYGTALHTAPERIDEVTTPNSLHIPDLSRPVLSPLDQAKAEDMYAIGCMMYELLFEQETPWSDEIDAFIKDPSDANRSRLSRRQTAARWTLESLIEQAAKGTAKDLLSCLKDLLSSDPLSRLSIDQFVDTIAKIRSETTSESVWIPINKGTSREVNLLKIATQAIEQTG